MKSVIHLSFVFSVILLLTSCYSSKMLVDDDVYVLKNNALPVGESLTDETAYSTFKHRKNKNKESKNYYHEDRNYLYANNCNYYSYDPFGCGCSFYAYNVYGNYYNPYGYGRPSLYYGHGFYNAFGNYVYDPFTGSYFYNPYYFDPYGYYPGSPYGSYYTGNYGYGQNPPTFNTPEIHSNQHSGPRGSISGFGNPAGRNNNTIVLKSAGAPTGKTNPNTVSTLRDRPIGRPTEDVRSNVSARPNVSTRPTNVRPAVKAPNTYRPSGEREIRTNPSQGRPAGARPSGIQQRPVQNREINPPRQNREAAPKGSGTNNPRGVNTPTPSGRRN